MDRIRSHPVVTTAGVALTIMLYSIITTYLTPAMKEVPELAFMVGLFASVGFYVVFFKISVWAYFCYMHERINPSEAITGDWIYKLEIRGKEHEPRFGICEIRRHTDCLTATGLHFNPSQDKFTSRFGSKAVLLDGQHLTVIYTSAGVDEDIFSRQGVYSLSTEGLPPQRIYGVWTDILPSRNAGDILMQRRDRNSEAMLREVGYPLDAAELRKALDISPPKALIRRRTSSVGPSRRRILFIRHAESEKNLEDRHGDSNDQWPLTEEGRKAAAIFAAALRKTTRPTVVFSSNARACIETSAILCAELEVPQVVDNGLRSIHFGVVSGKSRSEIREDFPEIHTQLENYHRGELHPKDYRIPGAETNKEFEARIRGSLLALLKVASGSIVVVAHRSTITMAVNIVYNWPATTDEGTYQPLTLPHLSITVIEVPAHLLNGTVQGFGLKIDDRRLQQLVRRP